VRLESRQQEKRQPGGRPAAGGSWTVARGAEEIPWEKVFQGGVIGRKLGRAGAEVLSIPTAAECLLTLTLCLTCHNTNQWTPPTNPPTVTRKIEPNRPNKQTLARHETRGTNRGSERQSVSHPASGCLRGKDQTQEGRDPQGTDPHKGCPHRGRPTHRGSDPHKGRDPHRRHTDTN